MYIEKMRAVAEPTFSITAALARPEIRVCRSMMAAADIDPTGRLTLAEVDRKLSQSRLRPADRIQVKLALTRAGILAD